ncbi:hypothetical protein ACFXJP_25380, partial [Streptomyces mirabilis]
RLLVDALFTEDTDRHWRMWFDCWNAGDQDPDRPSRLDARGAMLKGVTKGAPCPSARMLPPGKTDAVSCGGWLQDSPYWPATTVRGCAATCSPV